MVSRTQSLWRFKIRFAEWSQEKQVYTWASPWMESDEQCLSPRDASDDAEGFVKKFFPSAVVFDDDHENDAYEGNVDCHIALLEDK